MLASVRLPTNINIGEPTRLSQTIARVLERLIETPQNEATAYVSLKAIRRSSAASELLKIDILNIYVAACEEYSHGLAGAWTAERLLAVVTRWRFLHNVRK